MTEPKSVVLPLHHGSLFFGDAKIIRFSLFPNTHGLFFGKFVRINIKKYTMYNGKKLILHNLDDNYLFEKKIKKFLVEWCSEQKTVSVQTSGSTGKPKVFFIEKDKMRHSATMTCNFLGLNEGDTALICLPVEYISGKMMVVRSMIRNLKAYVSEPSIQPLKNLEQKIDFCALTPLQVENSLDKIHWIKKIIIGGAAVSESLKNKIFESLGENASTQIFETYGMSETLSHIALKEIYPKTETYFTIFEGVAIATDSRGCLTINAPQFNSQLLVTNDLVEIKNTNQFRFLGRVDNVINSGGAKIFPEQLEALVKKSIDREVVFIGIEDESLGQKLIAVVEGPFSEEIEEAIINANYEKSFHKPKEILFLNELPRTPNGKISRLQLKELLQ